jgi:hypothetical protein
MIARRRCSKHDGAYPQPHLREKAKNPSNHGAARSPFPRGPGIGAPFPSRRPFLQPRMICKTGSGSRPGGPLPIPARENRSQPASSFSQFFLSTGVSSLKGCRTVLIVSMYSMAYALHSYLRLSLSLLNLSPCPGRSQFAETIMSHFFLAPNQLFFSRGRCDSPNPTLPSNERR